MAGLQKTTNNRFLGCEPHYVASAGPYSFVVEIYIGRSTTRVAGSVALTVAAVLFTTTPEACRKQHPRQKAEPYYYTMAGTRSAMSNGVRVHASGVSP